MNPTDTISIQKQIISISKKFNEACNHWINPEVLEALPDRLKQVYVNSCYRPVLHWEPFDNAEWEMRIKCVPYNSTDCECTKKFDKTMAVIKVVAEDQIDEWNKKSYS